MNCKPFVTFGIITYRQQDMIGAAIEAALKQNYQNFEVLVSDDCSPDCTFEVLREYQKKYTGKIPLRVMQTPKNMGIGGNVSELSKVANGEIIVIAAGDDISKPNRIASLVEAFGDRDKGMMLLFSDYDEIDSEGKQIRTISAKPEYTHFELKRMCRELFSGVPGATSAWRKELFTEFGALLEGVTFEDRCIVFRALLKGKVGHVAEPLVSYRRHEGNTVAMFSESLNSLKRVNHCFITSYRSNLRDLDLWQKRETKDYADVRHELVKKMHKLEAYDKIYSGKFPAMTAGVLELLLLKGNFVNGAKTAFEILTGELK